MSCCSVRASHVLLIVHEYVPFELVVRCSSIAQRTPVLQRETRFVSRVRPRSDHVEVRDEVECNLMKKSRILKS
jgi:hypothetical protein